MTDVQSVQGLVVQVAILSFMVAGFMLMLGGIWRGGRRWAGRFVLLGILFAIVAALITPAWLP